MPKRARTKPLPFQREGIDRITEFGGRAVLADDMGLGKTFQSIRWAWENNAFPCVVICPASVKYNWQIECSHHLGLRADVLNGKKPQPEAWETRTPRFSIINYDILEGWLEYLISLRPKLVVLDECHMLGNKQSKRTKAVTELLRGPVINDRHKRVKHVIGLSGTPFTNRPINLFPVLQMVAPRVFRSRVEYGERYCEPVMDRGTRVYKGGANLDELRALLIKHCMIRRLKTDVLEQLPSITRNMQLLPLTTKATREYNKAKTDMRGWLKANGKKSSETAAKLARFTHLKMLAAELKMPQVQEWIKDFLENTDEKLCVFGIHKKILEPLHAMFPSVLVTGKVTGMKRQQAITKFRKDKKTRLLFGNLKAAGVGVNGLQDSCRHIAMVELGWDPATHTQAEARVWRMGQSRGCQIHYLLGKDTLEVDLCQLIQKKNQWFESAIDGTQKQAERFDLLQLMEVAISRK